MPLSIVNQVRTTQVTDHVIKSFLSNYISSQSLELEQTTDEKERLLIKHRIIDAKILLHSLAGPQS